MITHIRILSPIFAHAHIVKSFSMSSISRLLSTRFHAIGSNQIFVLALCQMAGDKKGKSKMVVQKKKKRTREDRE